MDFMDRVHTLVTQPRHGGLIRVSRVMCLLLFAALALCTGCKVGPNYSRPATSLPKDWTTEKDMLDPAVAAELSTWWRQLKSPELDLLVEQVLAQNLTLREAAARIEEARYIQLATVAQLRPDVFATGSSLHKQFSQRGNAFTPNSNVFQLNSLGFDATWELDLWGRIKRLNEAACADRNSAVESYRNLMVSLTAETARTYIEARTLQSRLAIAEKNLGIQRDTVDLAASKESAGLVSNLDVLQAKAEFHSTESEIPTLRQQLQQAYSRLCILQGFPPVAEIFEQIGRGPIPELPPTLYVGVPQDLLRRRPDIRQAEQSLIAENARVGVATAELYPKLSLNGTISVDSRDVANLFTGESLAHSVGPNVRWNFLSFGRVRAKIGAQEQRYLEAVAKYQQTVLLAAEETVNAMVSLEQERIRKESLANAAAASESALTLALDQYKNGLVSFQTVIEAQRQLLTAESELAQSQGQSVINLVKVYKAVGGGWQSPREVIVQTEVTEVAVKSIKKVR